MKIKSVTIENFRSISKLTIPFVEVDGKTCNILLGKNESGKSNILKALSLLDSNYEIDYINDCNKDSKKKNLSILVTYELLFNKDEFKEMVVKNLNVDKSLIDVDKIERKIEIDTNGRNDFYHIYLNEKVKPINLIIDEKDTIKSISEVYNGDVKITEDNIETIIPQHKLLNKDKLEQILEDELLEILDELIPEVIYWETSSEYLINDTIDLTAFKDNFSISIPLKNIFHIANIKDEEIRNRINLILKDDEERSELSQILSEEITEYVNKVWTEHKININVIIESNHHCIVNVEDKDYDRPKYKMEQRSDGFKQFISILLNLSAENKASILKNRLILLDEPEVHLHPSGIKYLRDELLKISENNSLVISTHSTYMIDKLNLKRHFSITKNKSITEIYQIQENNPYEEEVIYEALGTSIYEYIYPNIIIFEGKTDKDMFDIFSKKLKAELNTKNITAISANGVNAIEKYVKFFNNGSVKGFVVVDSDREGKQVKNNIISQNDNYNSNNTFEINDLIANNSSNKALEDLLPKEIVENICFRFFGLDITLIVDEPYVEQIKKIQKTINEKDLKLEIMKFIVEDINKTSMTKDKIKEKYNLYFEFVSNLYSKIK